VKILLLAGGQSSEREVSLASARAVHESLCRQGHEVLAIDPADGRSLLDGKGRFPDRDNQGGEALPVAVSSGALATTLERPDARDIEIVFIGLHGGSGENGTVQALLDLAGRKYTGSGMAASAIAMNKAVAKRLMQSEGIRTPEWKLYRLRNRPDVAELAADIAKSFSLPLIVKPNDSGSTVGLTKVDRPEQLTGAIEVCARESRDVLVEAHVPGREMTVAVLDGEPLPVVEIIPSSGLYDYEAKYTKGKSQYVAPAKISEQTSTSLQQAAARVYEVIGASGLARVDFILDEAGQGYCLELNTLPGMTALSLAPMAAACIGIKFDQLVDRIIRSALKE